MGKPTTLTREQVYINACLYGDPGCGKTRVIGTCGEKTLVLDADPGAEAIAAAGMTVDVWRTFDYHELTEAYEYLRHEDHDYEWVWLDSGTIFQERALHDQIMADVVAAKPHRNQYVPDVQEYLVNQNHLSSLVRHFVGLPINFGITAYAEDYDIGEDEKVFMPMFQGGKGSYSTKICGYMNLVAYLGVTKSDDGFQNRLLTQRRGRYYAKDRFGVLEPVIDSPNFSEITKTIQASMA